MDVTLTHYLVVDSLLFVIGILGIFLNYRNLLILLMCIELVLLAANLNFIAFSHVLNDQTGQIMAFFVTMIAAAEAAVGLSILIVYFRARGTLETNCEPLMKG